MSDIISAIDRQAEQRTSSQLLKPRSPDPTVSRHLYPRGVCASRLHSWSCACRHLLRLFSTITARREILPIDSLRHLRRRSVVYGFGSLLEARARSSGFIPGYDDSLPVNPSDFGGLSWFGARATDLLWVRKLPNINCWYFLDCRYPQERR
jgi:hypothetical protein